MKGLFVLGTATGVGKTLVSLDAIHSGDGLPEDHPTKRRSLQHIENAKKTDWIIDSDRLDPGDHP